MKHNIWNGFLRPPMNFYSNEVNGVNEVINSPLSPNIIVEPIINDLLSSHYPNEGSNTKC